MPVYERNFGPVCTHYNSLQLTTTHYQVLWQDLMEWADPSTLGLAALVRPNPRSLASFRCMKGSFSAPCSKSDLTSHNHSTESLLNVPTRKL